jgi:hypothetical protein
MRVHCSDEEQQDASGYRHRPDSQQSFVQHLVRDFKECLKSYSRKDQEQIWILAGGIQVIRYNHIKAVFIPHA